VLYTDVLYTDVLYTDMCGYKPKTIMSRPITVPQSMLQQRGI
jgi:hypothetical protein